MRFKRRARRSQIAALAVVIGSGVCAPLRGQVVRMESGVGFGMTTTSNHDYILHGYVAVQRPVTSVVELGMDASIDLNNDHVCTESCGLEFPDIAGVAMNVTVRHSRLAFGIGPGLFFRYLSTNDHVFAGGFMAHFDVDVARPGSHAIVASVRPLLALGAPTIGGERLGLIAASIGLRW